jgi:hypothetical protein
MNTPTKQPRKKIRVLTPLERAIRDFREQCWPDMNKVRMKRIENYLITVYTFKDIANPTPDQQREYYKASRILFQAGVC